MYEALGWIIGAAIVVAAGNGWRCWYRQYRDRT